MKWSATLATKSGSVADKIVRYFEANPDEELSAADVMTKFNVPYGATYQAIANLVKSDAFEFAPRMIRRKK